MNKSILCAMVAAAFLAGCANQRFNIAGELHLEPTAKSEDSQSFFVSGIGQKVPELDEKRLIQPQCCPQFTHLIRRGVLPQEKHHWVTHILKQHEGNERHRHHDECGLHQAPEDECKHVSVVRTKWVACLRVS